MTDKENEIKTKKYNKFVEENRKNISDAIAFKKKNTALLNDLLSRERAENKQSDRNERDIYFEKNEMKANKMWADVARQAKEMVQKGSMSSFQQFAQSILEGFNLLCQMVDAACEDKTRSRILSWVWKNTGEQIIYSDAAGAAKRVLSEVAEKAGIKQKPDLEYSVEFDEKGTINTYAAKNGVPLTDEQKSFFDAGLICWAEKNDCEFDPVNRSLKKDGEVMDFDTFRTMNTNSSASLEHFFNDNMSLRISPRI